jgi:hypothetical protein
VTTLELRFALVHSQLEHHLSKKWVEQVEQHRIMIAYAKQAKFLAIMDAKHERATLTNHRFKKEKASKVGEDTAKAKEVARSVKGIGRCMTNLEILMKLPTVLM